MIIIPFITKFFQKRKLARLKKENLDLALATAAARLELLRSPLEKKSIGQLRKLARRYPEISGACQAELNRRLYNGKLKLNQKAHA